MKHTWLGAALAALLLSGCSIYGNESARVVDRNVAYGQSGNFGGQGGLQPQQPQQGGFNFNGGYANAGQAVPPPVETKTVASNTPDPAAPAKAEGETAVSALLKKASGSLGKGDLDGAAAYLENAQRLDPKNSKILYDIANIRYHQGRYKEAESMASRAVQTGGSNAMLKKSWSLISNSRNKLGDSQGAVQAATKAASY